MAPLVRIVAVHSWRNVRAGASTCFALCAACACTRLRLMVLLLVVAGALFSGMDDAGWTLLVGAMRAHAPQVAPLLPRPCRLGWPEGSTRGTRCRLVLLFSWHG